MTITEFLLARIAEDEAGARGEFPYADEGENPRALRECEAKRKIIDLHTGRRHSYTFFCGDDTLEALATVYSDRPDYQPEWAPEWAST